MSDHILKVELGEFTAYHLTCNLDDTAPCHQTCQRHPEGGCGEPESEGECITSPYEGGCVVAEWVNDGGIEGVEFEHVLELPVAYHWDGGHDFPILVAQSDESLRAELTATRQRLEILEKVSRNLNDYVTVSDDWTPINYWTPAEIYRSAVRDCMTVFSDNLEDQ